jgi:HlyD family secretion protein
MSEQSHSSLIQYAASILTSVRNRFKFRSKRKLAIVLGSTAAVVTVVIVLAFGSAAQGDPAMAITAPVTLGPLTVQVTESGELEAEHREIISNEARWTAYITSVAAEGSIVKIGDEIVRFECKDLTDAVNQQRITVTNAENDYTQANENVEVVNKEVANATYKAEQALIEAQENLRRYIEGEGPMKLGQAETTIQMAQRDLTLAEGKLDFKKTANQDPELNNPYSLSEIKADELSLDRLKESCKKATLDRDMLIKYDDPQSKRKYEMAIKDAELNLEKAKIDARTKIRLAGTTEQAKKITFDRQSEKLKELLEDDAKMAVRAKRDGLVVYDTGRWRGDSSIVVEVGAKIEPRQQIMSIPDMSSLRVKTKIYETMVDQVQKDTEAFVRLDAKPGVILPGKVEKVAVLPDSSNWLNPTAKAYVVYIKLDSLPDGLKPGMTSQVNMILARLPSVLSVPITAVFSEQENKFCYRVAGGKSQKVSIVTGRMSDTRVEVLSGLSADDKVLLTPPVGAPTQSGIQSDKNNKSTSRPASQPTSQPASQPASEPTTNPSDNADDQPSTQPATQPASTQSSAGMAVETKEVARPGV